MSERRPSLPRLRVLWFALLVAVLVASIPAYKLIPAWGLRPWGFDLDNVYVFHHCAGRDDPYVVTGFVCGDPLGRAMPYPPFMYWLLGWMRWVSFPAARRIWASFIVLALLSAAVVWSADGAPLRIEAKRWRSYLFGALLVAEFPAAFALERGNNDAVVVLLWTAAIALLTTERFLLAGVAAGLAAAAKLYPALSCAVVAVGLAGAAFSGGLHARRRAIAFFAGLGLSLVVTTLLFGQLTLHYYTNVLPPFAAHIPGVTLHGHSVPATFGARAGVISELLALVWAAAALASFERAPALVLAGALAISTYFAATSFDYNLVTVYPLLLVLFARAMDPAPRAGRWADWAVLYLGVAAVLAHRGWFGEARAERHVALQVAWLVAAAVRTLFVGRAAIARPADAD
jgi:Glycosyltransferase family 87